MVGKKIVFYTCSLLLTLTLTACSKIPENINISTPKETPAIVKESDTSISDIKDTETEKIPSEQTDKPADIKKEESTTSETTAQTVENEINPPASENSQTVTNGESIENNTYPTPTAQTQVTAVTVPPAPVSPSTEKTEKTESTTSPPAISTTAPPKTEPQITTENSSVTEPELVETETETAAEPPLTGGAYNQRYCTEKETEFAQRVFELTNLEREKEGLPKFEKMDILGNVALTRAWELTVEYRADHSRPDGSICTGAYNENGIIYGGLAENIAAGQDTPEGVVEAWMNSPSHRAAILNEDYTYLGVGYYYIKDDYQSYYHFWTQEFYHY